MSSGLPVNSFSQAREYRNRYLANLALEVQNDMMNLNANQVFKQTGQPSRPPDSRSTTEKLADLEGLKVSLRAGFLGITDGTQASETVDQLTPDEVMFASQQLPAITADLKPRFVRGVPSNALLNYIRALRRKELQTNGVSFSAQESTAQQILNALQAGQINIGGNAGPIPGGPGNPVNPPPPGPPGGRPPGEAPPIVDLGPSEEELLAQENALRRQADIRRRAEEFLASGREPFTSLPRNVQDMVNQIRAEQGKGGQGGIALLIGRFKQDQDFRNSAGQDAGLRTLAEWNAFPVPGGFAPNYPDSDDIAKEYLRMWGKSQTPEIQALFSKGWDRKKTPTAMKTALFPGWQMKNATIAEPTQEADPFDTPQLFPGGSSVFDRMEMPSLSRQETIGTVVPDYEGSMATTRETRSTREAGESRGITNAITFRDQMDSPSFSNEELARMVKTFMTSNRIAPERLRDISFDTPVNPESIFYKNPASQKRSDTRIPIGETNLLELIAEIRGTGIRRRAGAPASRYPIGREILGYGLSRGGVSSRAKSSEFVGMPVAEVSFSPFGKFIVDTNKLASNILDVRTQRGNKIPKYKQHQMSGQLAKTMKRIMGGRMIDEYDFNEMPMEDQTYLWDLAKDAKIMDRLNLPTPKRTKDGEEENRFEILKGQIMAGNDSKELVKEFKTMLLKFSNDGRIKKAEAREILLDLTAMGY